MDSELEKVVESGKLTSKSAKQLEQLRPGSFCLHKSWGFGQVAEWNLLLNQVVIDFKTKPKHPMQLVYAAENLTPIPAQHFLARKLKEPDVIKALLKSDPAAVVRNILEGFDGKAALTQISEVLVGDLFTEAEWKRWWTSAKKALKASGYAMQTGRMTLADDSGLEVEALGGRPGVLSARYGGPTFDQKMSMLLNELDAIGDEARRARFVAAIAIADETGRILHAVEGICAGTIAAEPRGSGGFGYDPLFIPDGYDLTFGELPETIKREISHRGRAFSQIMPFLRGFFAI